MVGSVQEEYFSTEHKLIGLYMDFHHVFCEVEPNVTLLFRLISCSTITTAAHAKLSQQRPDFYSGSIRVRYVVEKVAV
jgi:hypothetical protein